MNVISKIYEQLLNAFGHQNWWPADSPLEVMVGAVLTQNTNWKNVEKAITQLKNNHILTWKGLLITPEDVLAQYIRSAGYYNLKSRRLKNLIQAVYDETSGNLDIFRKRSVETNRQFFLQINGIGPETADAILLYAIQQPIFVVDAYTSRFLYRHGMIDEKADYQQIQQLFHNELPLDEKLFNEYHALIIELGKKYCSRTNPKCIDCPLRHIEYDITQRCETCYRRLDDLGHMTCQCR